MRDSLAGKKILFANFPGDGHFNPLTGIAMHLKELGCDVRWYSSKYFSAKLQKLNIRHYAFKKAIDFNADNFESFFPDRSKNHSQIAKLKFDITNLFILRGPEFYEDIRDIYEEFPFDMLIADCAFTGSPFVKELLHIPVISIGVMPLSETSRDLPPAGLGMTPSTSLFGKLKQAVLRKVSDKMIFGGPNKVMWKVFDQYGVPHRKESLFDMIIKKSDLLLQSGTPGFEYSRSDLSQNIRFVGPLLPHVSKTNSSCWYDPRLAQFRKVIIVTQGTVEKDVNKIIVPTLEAYKDSDTLVIATTGGTQTLSLRMKYPQKNIIIEDFIPFNDVMPHASVYITNGGYGGVMLGIQNKLPQVVAGKHEGKNEICARIGYFNLGINLKTETPTATQLKKAVDEVLSNYAYRENVIDLAKEFATYMPFELSAQYINEVLTRYERPNLARA